MIVYRGCEIDNTYSIQSMMYIPRRLCIRIFGGRSLIQGTIGMLVMDSHCSMCKSHLTTPHPANLPFHLGREDPVVLENQCVFLISYFKDY